MDCRITIHKDYSFLNMLEDEYKQNRKVNLLIDSNGLSRAEGFIKSIRTNPSSIELDNNEVILLSQVIAVNGIFSADFSEC